MIRCEGCPNKATHRTVKIDLRAIVRAAIDKKHGTQAAFARAIAPRWGISEASAVHDVSRYLRGGDILGARLEAMLSELGLLRAMARYVERTTR